jgi:hypothetical protein
MGSPIQPRLLTGFALPPMSEMNRETTASKATPGCTTNRDINRSFRILWIKRGRSYQALPLRVRGEDVNHKGAGAEDFEPAHIN